MYTNAYLLFLSLSNILIDLQSKLSSALELPKMQATILESRLGYFERPCMINLYSLPIQNKPFDTFPKT